LLLLNELDNSDSDSLLHVSDSESSERGVLREGLNNHGFLGDELDDGGFLVLDFLGFTLLFLSSSSVDLGEELLEFAGDVRGVAIEDWAVSGLNLVGMVQDDDLSVEADGLLGGVVLGVSNNVSSSNILDSDVLNVESDIVSGDGFLELSVMHFDSFALSGDTAGGEGDEHSGSDDSGFNSSDGDCSNSSNLVDVLKGKSEGLFKGSDGGVDFVEGLEEGVSLVPGHLVALGDQVVSSESGVGDGVDVLLLESDLLKVVDDFLLDVEESFFFPVGGVHLVDGEDHLLDSHSVGEEGVFSGLSFLSESSFELSGSSGDDEDGNIGLRGSGNHILNEISVSGGVDDGEGVLVGLEFPEGDIDGDTSFSFGLELVEDPGVLE